MGVARLPLRDYHANIIVFDAFRTLKLRRNIWSSKIFYRNVERFKGNF